MKILCICPIGIGNYLMTYPACSLLRSSVNNAELHLLALRQSIVELAHGDPLWHSVHWIDPTRQPSIRRQWSFIRELSEERFDGSLSFFPSNNWQYNLLPFLCGVAKRYAFGYPLKKGYSLSFLNNRLLAIDLKAHDINQNVRLVSSFSGVTLSAERPAFPSLFTEKEVAESHRFLEKIGGPQVYVGVHPGSSSEHGMQAKRWDPMRFGELATRICSTLNAQALIFGSPDEEKIKHVTTSIMKAPYRIVAPLGLQMTAALLHRCALLLCNDSGLMHMAACMGVPTAAVFGPTDERRNGPAGTGHLVIRKGSPLWTAATAGVRAVRSGIDPQSSLKALSVDEAWEKVLPWLTSNKSSQNFADYSRKQ
jgi:ADP-heptose:LPS heptosyltransferase